MAVVHRSSKRDRYAREASPDQLERISIGLCAAKEFDHVDLIPLIRNAGDAGSVVGYREFGIKELGDTRSEATRLVEWYEFAKFWRGKSVFLWSDRFRCTYDIAFATPNPSKKRLAMLSPKILDELRAAIATGAKLPERLARHIYKADLMPTGSTRFVTARYLSDVNWYED